ncbi:MAG: LysM peptidoglycan-binding domain-containing protein [Methylococcales symbiont of Hymedesmia sp. n. MRB-2018]|nr:MAG: LysM peptidoglycan-binding domain-containing protein [Methylococcales symbiont of Hymedesmia sp. n. MRB-2018]KAF3983468.1 MAG: LysM peptidoglycan-binding domain-containing protein [Methylococcales symbiont of Hymedesmia sp. n. MRB-2018]
MAFGKTVGFVFLLLFSVNIWADTLQINPNHPDQYTVVKGDTLWGVSAQFLENPWQWPQLWENNPQIKNSHLIYPGDILHFSMVDGKPQLSFSKNVKLKPKIRESDIDQAIKIIPTDAISQFLISPKVVGSMELSQSPYVVDFVGEHIIAAAGDKIYVKSITAPKSFSYTIYREGEVYVSPATNEILGYEAKYIADTTLVKAGDPATLSIIKSSREIKKGDRLMVSDKAELALNFFPHPPEKQIMGSIISVLNGVSQIGQYNIVVIDKGLADGLHTGHVLDIYQRGEIVDDIYAVIDEKGRGVKLPDELAGVLMIFRPFDRVSYALVAEATRAIHLLDVVQTP